MMPAAIGAKGKLPPTPLHAHKPKAVSPPALNSAAWLPNALTDSCLACGEEFSFLKRRHHCRRCGLLFCAECSTRRATLRQGHGPVRVCDRCYGKVIVDQRRQEREKLTEHDDSSRVNDASQSNTTVTSDSVSTVATGTSGAASVILSDLSLSDTEGPHSRRAEHYWRKHVRIDANEIVKLHIADVTLWLGRVQDLELMSEEEIHRRVRHSNRRKANHRKGDTNTDKSDVSKALSLTWHPSLGNLPPPALTISKVTSMQPSSRTISKTPRPSQSSPQSAATLPKSSSLTSINTLDGDSTDPSQSQSLTVAPQHSPTGSPLPSPYAPYVEDELALDDSPVIVDLKRRASSVDGYHSQASNGNGTGSHADVMAKYRDRMIVIATHMEKSKKEQRDRHSTLVVKQPHSYNHSHSHGQRSSLNNEICHSGHLIISNFQLTFIPLHLLVTDHTGNEPCNEPQTGRHGELLLPVIKLPLLSIAKLTPLTFEAKDAAVLSIKAKDFRSLHFLFTGLLRQGRYANYKNATKSIEFYATPSPGDGLATVFAFKYQGRVAHSHAASDPGSLMVSNSSGSENQWSESNSEDPSSLTSPTGTAETVILFGKANDETDDDSHDIDDSSDQLSINLPIICDAVNQRPLPLASDISDSDIDISTDGESLSSELSAAVTPTGVRRTVSTNDGVRLSFYTDTHIHRLNQSPRGSMVALSDSPSLAAQWTAINSTTTILPAPIPLMPRISSLSNDYHFIGWDLFDPITEFARMNIPNKFWRLTTVNQSYGLCASYPSVLAVPKRITDSDLVNIRAFRTRHRLPVLCWRASTSSSNDDGSGPVLLRSAQPMVGIMNQRNDYDEQFMQYAVNSNRRSSTLIIVDARPSANARANQALGAGTEIAENYVGSHVKHCHVEYLNVENIHAVRKSYKSLHSLIERMIEEEISNVSITNGNSVSVDLNLQQFWPSLASTLHFYHLSTLLTGANYIVSMLSDYQHTVLIHCSDGWDRTNQLTSLSSLMLDSHYRTLTGFMQLIDKEFSSYGHKFGDRGGYGLYRVKGEESPIFHQFIDCVDQLRHQQPDRFEFNGALLILLLDEINSHRFGNFLLNSEFERIRAGISARTGSLWGMVLSDRHPYVNPHYQRYDGVVQCDIQLLRFHTAYYMRYHYRRSISRQFQQSKEGDANSGAMVCEVKSALAGLVDSVVERATEEKIKALEARIAELQSQPPRTN